MAVRVSFWPSLIVDFEALSDVVVGVSRDLERMHGGGRR